MQGDGLREPILSGSSAWASGRFSSLLLQHNEYYFSRQDAVAMLPLPLSPELPREAAPRAEEGAAPPDGQHDAPPPHARRCTGVLHVSSKSIFFEPSEAGLAVVSIPLAKVERFTPWEPDADERTALEDCGVEVGSDAAAQRNPANDHRGPAPGSPTPSRSAGGWFSGLKTQLLGTTRSSKSTAGPDPARRTRVRWDLCQIEAEQIATQLKHGKCYRPETAAPRAPLRFAIKQEEDTGRDAPSASDDAAARAQPLECSVLITLLMSEATAKLDGCSGGTSPWAPWSPLLKQLIKEHEIGCLAQPPPRAATTGHQRILCRGRAVRVWPLAVSS
jgi:hypothetical protein